ncbi:hypothetical protein [Phenylobacterium sp.]|uniref:hypothetical protein n=1 Tax=Phenylobacterium sp. TaxID=1871053 RepID=UPI0030F43AC0
MIQKYLMRAAFLLVLPLAAWASDLQPLRHFPAIADIVKNYLEDACGAAAAESVGGLDAQRADVDGDPSPDYVVALSPVAIAACGGTGNYLVITSGSGFNVARASANPVTGDDLGSVGPEANVAVEAAPEGAEEHSEPSEPGTNPTPQASKSDPDTSQSGAVTEPVAAERGRSGVIIGLVLTLALTVLGGLAAGVVIIAQRTFSKYGYRVFLDWWNLLYVPIALLLVFGVTALALAGGNGFLALAIPAAILWVLRIVINIRRTSFAHGLLISVIQLTCIGFVVIALVLRRAQDNAESGRAYR